MIKSSMRVLILAAGYGTRLYPMTVDLPKALIPLKRRVILDIILEKINNLKSQYSVDSISVVSNNRFYKRFLEWKTQVSADVEILNDGSNEPSDRLGAIGDINFAISKYPDQDWLVLGSDNLFDWQLNDFVDFSQQAKPRSSVGVYSLGDKEQAKRFGVVELNDQGRVVKFAEKPQDPQSDKIAVCIYFFPKESLADLKKFMNESSSHDLSGKYIEWLANKDKVDGYLFNGKWVDIGSKDSLAKAENI